MRKSNTSAPLALVDEVALQRVVIVGTSCSGKTTLAHQLAHTLQVPHQELDSLHWRPNWTPTPKDEFRSLVAEAVTSDTWVIDGNYSAVRDVLWERATTLIWLNYPFPTVLSRALKRTCRRVFQRQILWPESSANRETFRHSFLSQDSILWWVLTTYHRRRREYPQLLQSPQYRHLNIVVLTSPKEAERFLHAAQKRW